MIKLKDIIKENVIEPIIEDRTASIIQHNQRELDKLVAKPNKSYSDEEEIQRLRNAIAYAKSKQESVIEGQKKQASGIQKKFDQAYLKFSREVRDIIKMINKYQGDRTDGKIIDKEYSKHLIPFNQVIQSWTDGQYANPNLSEGAYDDDADKQGRDDGDSWMANSSSGDYGAKYKGQIRYFDDEDSAKSYASSGSKDSKDSKGGEEEKDKDDTGKLSGSDFDREADKEDKPKGELSSKEKIEKSNAFFKDASDSSWFVPSESETQELTKDMDDKELDSLISAQEEDVKYAEEQYNDEMQQTQGYNPMGGPTWGDSLKKSKDRLNALQGEKERRNPNESVFTKEMKRIRVK